MTTTHRTSTCRSLRIFLAGWPLTGFMILGLGGSGWLVREAIAPITVQAYTSQASIVLTREPGESYDALLRRAEAAARAVAQQSFDRDILVTEVAITVVGEADRQAAPLLTLSVSRDQWRSLPDPQRWATYYRTARSLLGFGEGNPSATTPSASTAPTVAPTASSPQAPDPSATRVPTPTDSSSSPSNTGTTGTTDILEDPGETLEEERGVDLPRLPGVPRYILE